MLCLALTDIEMGLFLILLWRAAAKGLCGVPNIFPVIPGSANLIPDWAVLNSRLAPLRELLGKGLICLTVLAGKGRKCGQNRENSRFDGK
jgi:hypothetical protein